MNSMILPSEECQVEKKPLWNQEIKVHRQVCEMVANKAGTQLDVISNPMRGCLNNLWSRDILIDVNSHPLQHNH